MSRDGAAHVFWGVVLGALVAATAPADAAEGRSLDVRAGFSGRWRVGSWAPLVISSPADEAGHAALLTAGDTVHVWAEDMDGQMVRSPPVVAELKGDRVEAHVGVRFGRPSGRYRIEAGSRDDAREHTIESSLADPIPSTTRVIACYGDLPELSRAARLVDRDQGGKTLVITDGAPHAAGAAARDFDGADAIVVCGSAVAGLPAAVLAGIDSWTRSGGRLVFIAGASASSADQQGPPVSDWIPGRLARLAPLRRLGAVEAYARAGGLADRVPLSGVLVPRLEPPLRGIVEVAVGEAAGGQPLVVRTAHGLGTITWIGLDLDLEPIRGWGGTEQLMAAVLGGRSRGGGDARPADEGGVPDLAGQLHAALDTFAAAPSSAGAAAEPGVRPVPFEVIAGLGLLYVLSLYPLDWWLVSRSGRPWLAWITLPLLAGGFTLAAWMFKDRWLSAPKPVARSAGVLDVDAATRRLRGSSWLAVHSPANDRLDVAVEPPALSFDAESNRAVSWWGVVGRGFGGLDSSVPHPSLAAADYAYAGSLAELDGVPVAASASRLFEAEWIGAIAAEAVTSSLVLTGQGTLSGAVAHHLPFPLEGCRLLHAGWLYDVGRLAPGDRYDLATGRGPRSLASALTRRAAAKDREAGLRWDPTGTDVARILEVAGFHAAAGGTPYSGLPAGRLARLDLSPLLAVDRAVLVGTIANDAQAAGWTVRTGDGRIDAAPAASALCRIVIPLAAEAAP